VKQVNVERRKLLEIIRTNRARHHDEYVKAMQGWREDTLKILKQNADILERNSVEPLQEIEHAPLCHLTEYDRATMMLEMSVDENIVIEESDFYCYVQDQWGWKRMWQVSNMKYLTK